MTKWLYVPNPLLRQKAKNIESVGTEELKIAEKMKKIMLKAPGVGLAANQIGILKKINRSKIVMTKLEKEYFIQKYFFLKIE